MYNIDMLPVYRGAGLYISAKAKFQNTSVSERGRSVLKKWGGWTFFLMKNSVYRE